jgi:hypothetical protein
MSHAHSSHIEPPGKRVAYENVSSQMTTPRTAKPPRTPRDVRGDSDKMDLAKTGDIARSPYGYAGAVDGLCLLSSDKAGLQKVATFMSFLHEKDNPQGRMC